MDPVPYDPARLAGLIHERQEARARSPILDPATSAGSWAKVDGGVAPARPCGECKHWRFSAGQEVVTRLSVKLDLTDIGWARYAEMRELGRCAQNEELLAHRLATCPKWETV